jgi:hypothetical protein
VNRPDGPRHEGEAQDSLAEILRGQAHPRGDKAPVDDHVRHAARDDIHAIVAYTFSGIPTEVSLGEAKGLPPRPVKHERRKRKTIAFDGHVDAPGVRGTDGAQPHIGLGFLLLAIQRLALGAITLRLRVNVEEGLRLRPCWGGDNGGRGARGDSESTANAPSML